MNLWALAMGIILLAIGVTFLYTIPDYVISVMNETGMFSASDISEANTKVDNIRNIGFIVIFIAVVFMIFGVFGGKGKVGI